MQLLQLLKLFLTFVSAALLPSQSVFINNVGITLCLLDCDRLTGVNISTSVVAIGRLGERLHTQFLCQLEIVVIVIVYRHRDLLRKHLGSTDAPFVSSKELIIFNVFTFDSLVTRRLVLVHKIVFCIGKHFLMLLHLCLT